jgi:hypothetical protein
MDTHWRSAGIASCINFRTRRMWVVSLTPQLLYLQGKSPDTDWTERWEGVRARLDSVANRKRSLPYPFQESNSGRQACTLITVWTVLPRCGNKREKKLSNTSSRKCWLYETLWSRVLLEKLTVTACQQFLTLYGTRKFTTMFRTARRHWSLSWDTRNQFRSYIVFPSDPF